MLSNIENERLSKSSNNKNWKRWGLYVQNARGAQLGKIIVQTEIPGITLIMTLQEAMPTVGVKKQLAAFVIATRFYALPLLFGTAKMLF